MNKLPAQVKIYILQSLGAFASPSEVVRSVKEVFGLDVTPPQVEAYNSERAAGARLRPMLRRVFYEAREAAAADLDTIPLAHQAYRLRALERLHHRAAAQGNIPLAARILEIAAKDVGGAYTNRRGGGPERRPR